MAIHYDTLILYVEIKF